MRRFFFHWIPAFGRIAKNLQLMFQPREPLVNRLKSPKMQAEGSIQSVDIVLQVRQCRFDAFQSLLQPERDLFSGRGGG